MCTPGGQTNRHNGFTVLAVGDGREVVGKTVVGEVVVGTALPNATAEMAAKTRKNDERACCMVLALRKTLQWSP